MINGFAQKGSQIGTDLNKFHINCIYVLLLLISVIYIYIYSPDFKSLTVWYVTKSIPYSQALRIRRICSTDKSLKNDWVSLKIIWKEGVTNKILSRKVLTKLITSPGAAYFSTKKNRNVKEPLVSSHTIPVWETASTPFVGIGHPSKKIPNCPKSFLSLPWLPSNNQTVWETCWCGQRCQSLTQL